MEKVSLGNLVYTRLPDHSPLLTLKDDIRAVVQIHKKIRRAFLTWLIEAPDGSSGIELAIEFDPDVDPNGFEAQSITERVFARVERLVDSSRFVGVVVFNNLSAIYSQEGMEAYAQVAELLWTDKEQEEGSGVDD